MASGAGFAAEDDPDPLLRPAWEDTEDETDSDRRPTRTRRLPGAAPAWLDREDLATLLVPLCEAIDALARLDARAAAAEAAVRDGLLARMAYLEAAGFLAHTHAWVHPIDLALRDLGLTAPTALAALGAPHRSLPQTFASTSLPDAWADPPLDHLPVGDAAVTEALTLARLLRRLPRHHTPADLAAALTALGAGGLDAGTFAAWWESMTPAPAARRRHGRRGEGARPDLPPLLAAAAAARCWMEAGLATATPAQALLLAAAVLARSRLLHAVVLPIWTAWPPLGFGDRDALPTLRSDAADRLLPWGQRVSWPLAFLHLATEGARMALRELDRLEGAAGRGGELGTMTDRRSRLADAIDVLLRTPVLTSKVLAARLDIAPQTATALLRALAAEGLAREVTGRGRFRAFAA
jgi:hypothetical protein